MNAPRWLTTLVRRVRAAGERMDRVLFPPCATSNDTVTLAQEQQLHTERIHRAK